MPRKTTSRSLKKKADKLWSLIIRARGKCEASELGECKGILNACHIIRRGNNAVRHDLENGLSLCVKHHYWFDKGDKFEVTSWFEKKWPLRYGILKAKNQIVHYKKHDWERIVKELKEIYGS